MNPYKPMKHQVPVRFGVIVLNGTPTRAGHLSLRDWLPPGVGESYAEAYPGIEDCVRHNLLHFASRLIDGFNLLEGKYDETSDDGPDTKFPYE